LARVGDGDGLARLAGLAAERFDLLDNVHALDDGAKDDVLVVQPRGLDRADKELGAVSVGAGIGHGQNTRSDVLKLEVFVGKLFAVDGLAAGAVVVGEVATLAHEVRNDPVKATALEAEPLLTGAQGTEILSRLGDNIRTELHDDATDRLAVDGHVEKHLGQHLCSERTANGIRLRL